jgi:uncharacterized glyoxalase superfamily protein PhnB
MAVNPIPDGYHSVTPYLIVAEPERLIDFLKQAFAAEEIERLQGPDGAVISAEIRIGDSIIKMGKTMGEFPAMPASLYLYTGDTDAAYQRALQAGAASIMAPFDHFRGDREAGVSDVAGNVWWIATRTRDVSPEEMRKGLEAFMRQIGQA